MKPVLLDTSVIVAALDRAERRHEPCATALVDATGPLVTCEAVITEACYLLRNLGGAREAVLDNVSAGIFQIAMQLGQEAADVKRLLAKYHEHEIDLADACLIHLATELGTGTILTLDRDFQIFRWGRNRAFEIVPELS